MTPIPSVKPEFRVPKVPGRRVRVTADREKELLAAFIADLSHSSDGKRQRAELALRAIKAFRAFTEKTKSVYFTDLYIPVVFSAIMTKVAAEYEAVAKSPPLISYEARKESGEEVADLYNALVDYHLGERNYKLPILEIFMSKALFGHAYCVAYWKEEWREVADWGEVQYVQHQESVDPYTGAVSYVPQTISARSIVKSNRKTIDSPWFSNIHFLEAFPDWGVSIDDFQDSRYFIHLKLRSPSYVQQRFKAGAWSHPDETQILEGSDWLEDGTLNNGGADSETIRSWQQSMGLIPAGTNHTPSEGRLYEVAEYYRPDGVVTVLNRRWVVCYKKGYPLGKMPIISIPNHIAPGEPFGLSDFEIIEKLNINVQNMSNAAASEALLCAFPVTIAAPGVDGRALSMGPGRIVTTPDPKSISYLQRPNSGVEVSNAQVASGLRMIDDGLGLSEVARGAMPSREQSATAVAQSVGSAARRIFLTIDLINDLLLRPLGQFYRDMIRLMQSEEITVRLRRDGSKVQVNLDMLDDADLDVIPQANASAMRELDRKQLLDFLTLVSNYQIQSVDKEEICRIVARNMIPKYYTNVVRTAEQMQQAQQQQMIQAHMEAQQQGGGQQPQGSPPPSSNRVFDRSNGMNQEQAGTMNV